MFLPLLPPAIPLFGGVMLLLVVYVRMHVPVCVHAEARGRCELSSSITPSPYFLRQSLSLNPKLTFQRGWLGTKLVEPAYFCPSVLGLQAGSHSWLLHRCLGI